jgi:hypothetical protein
MNLIMFVIGVVVGVVFKPEVLRLVEEVKVILS